jgi:hypothetical protein
MHLIVSQDEKWRLDRLEKAIKLICAIAGLNRWQISLLVAELEDHKGDLWVRWRTEPSDRIMAAFDDAWRLCGEPNTQHYKPCPVTGDWDVAA